MGLYEYAMIISQILSILLVVGVFENPFKTYWSLILISMRNDEKRNNFVRFDLKSCYDYQILLH